MPDYRHGHSSSAGGYHVAVLLVRPARGDDLAAIERIVNWAYERYVERIGREPAPMLDDYALKLREATVLVAEDGVLVGVIVLSARSDHLLIENVAVDPSRQGQGVGRALLAVAERHAAELGLGELRLYTNAAMTENLRFYPRLGYVEVARRVDDGFDRVYFAKLAPPSMQMQAERLVLRPMRQADAERLHTVYSDPCVMRYVPGGPLGRAGTAARVRSAVEHQLTYGFSKWAVILADGGEVIGDCGIQHLEGGPAIELGFHIRRSHWGDGYATEAARAWLSRAQASRPEPLVAIVDPRNTASVRVLRKLRMRCTGRGTHFGRSWDVWAPGEDPTLGAVTRPPP